MGNIDWVRTIKAIMTILSIILSFLGGQNEQVQDFVRGNRPYVVMSAPGSINMLSGHGKIIGTMKNRPGYQMKLTKSKAADLRAQGFEVYPDRTYKLDVSKECPPCDAKPPSDGGDIEGDEIPWGTERVKAMQAQARITGKKVKVCIVDTGIDSNHPQLRGTVTGGASYVRGVSSYEDDQGHGTHVAGTIAALKDGQGIVGVAAGIAQLHIIKVLASNGSGQGSWIADGIYDCVNSGAEIISMSLGSPRQYGPDPLIKQATDYAVGANVKVIAANGNDGGGVGYPAANPGVYGVAASDQSDRLANFSSRGDGTDYIAPGVGIKSTKMGGGYITWDGTSMATPHVAGVWALCLAIGCSDLKTDNLGLPATHQGRGLPNAFKTVNH